MKYITGEKLLTALFQRKNIAAMKSRFVFPSLMQYLEADEENKVCALYGLRRTGKTILMAQAAQALHAPEEICWLFCENGDTMQSVKKVIDENPSCKYFFLDEVTRLTNFMETSSILSDYYASVEGKKIVLAGTDSLGFHFAFGTELFDRARVIHTTYIPFKEYRYLLGKDKTFDDYIEYGGTLTDGSVFYNQEAGMDYTNDAIAENIQHTLEKFRDGDSFGPLLSLYDKDELTTCINKLVELSNRTFLKKTINRMFKSHDMGKLQSNLQRDISITADSEILSSTELREEIRKALDIKDKLSDAVSDKAVEEIKRYLEQLDVIYVVPGTDRKMVLFTQPGLRYSQVRKEMEILKESPVLSHLSPSDRELFAKRLDDTVKGVMMEDIIFVDLSRDKWLTKSYQVSTYRDAPGFHEFDLVLIDPYKNECVLLEVKHSSAYVPESQARHLSQREACQEAEEQLHVRIKGKAVIYQGENRYYQDGISYWNVADFLEDPLACLQETKARYLDSASEEKASPAAQDSASLKQEAQPKEQPENPESLLKKDLSHQIKDLKQQGVSLAEIGKVLQSAIKETVKEHQERKEK